VYRPHHDLLIGGDTYTVGAAIASKCHFIRAARCVITQTRPLHFAAVSFLFQREISAVSRPIAAKLCHMIGNGAVLKIRSKNWGYIPTKIGAEMHAFFGAISDDFALRSRISPERNKTSTIGKRRCKLRSLTRLLT